MYVETLCPVQFCNPLDVKERERERERESWLFCLVCLVIDVWLFLAMPLVCLQFVIVAFPDLSHLLYLVSRMHESLGKPRDSTCILEALPGKLNIKRHSCNRLSNFTILGQVWYLIVSFPDLCRLSYFV